MDAKPAGLPVVSVVTPTLNQGAYIEATLRSVRAQAYGAPLVEHIVVDGGSTDGTLDVLRREGDAGRIRWISEPDRGMYDAVNKGLAMARGEILAYLNSDDCFFPWAVATAVEAFDRSPVADLVFGDGLKVDEESGSQRLRLLPPFDAVSLANFESITQPSVFWRRRTFERLGGFDTDLRYVADLDYWLRAAAAGLTIQHVDEVLAIERLHAERLSDAHRGRMAEEDVAMRTRHAGADPARGGQLKARARHNRWQRRLWRRFLAASAGPSGSGPWRHFRQDGQLRIARARIAVEMLGRAPDRHLADAVRSELAGQVLAARDS